MILSGALTSGWTNSVALDRAVMMMEKAFVTLWSPNNGLTWRFFPLKQGGHWAGREFLHSPGVKLLQNLTSPRKPLNCESRSEVKDNGTQWTNDTKMIAPISSIVSDVEEWYSHWASMFYIHKNPCFDQVWVTNVGWIHMYNWLLHSPLSVQLNAHSGWPIWKDGVLWSKRSL